MKVKLLIGRSGPAGAQNVGDEVDVGNAEAKRLIDAGKALPVRSAKKETATSKTKTEKATQ